MSHFGRGRVLRAEIDCPTYDATYFDPRGEQDQYFPITAPYLKLAAVQGHNGTVTLFALNRHLTEPMTLTVTLNGFAASSVIAARTLHHPNLNATNTRDAPDTVRPEALQGASVTGDILRTELPPASWNVLRLG
jgi:alpha-N-arabinofuranosidase